MSASPAARPAVSAEPPAPGLLDGPPAWRTFLSRLATLCLVELRKVRHDRTELYTRAIQPVLWLVIFGETLSRLRAIPTGGHPYLDYLAPGIMAQSALFIAIFFGIQIIWERDAGILTKLLTTPTARAALVCGKAFAAGVRATAQVLIVFVVCAILAHRPRLEPAPPPRRADRRRARRRLLLAAVGVDRRGGAEARPADGDRAGDHDATLLRLERALPGVADARAGCAC